MSIDMSALNGLELIRWLQANDSDDIPSIRRLIGMRFDEVDHGRVAVSVESNANFSNPQGTVHGGIYATLLDSAMGCAVHTVLDPAVSYTTLEIKVNYVRSARVDGQRLRAVGTVIHHGRTTATAEGQMYDESDKLIAHATTTCLILPPRT